MKLCLSLVRQFGCTISQERQRLVVLAFLKSIRTKRTGPSGHREGTRLLDVGLTSHFAGMGDLNGDGKPEILWQNDSGLPSLHDHGRHRRHQWSSPA